MAGFFKYIRSFLIGAASGLTTAVALIALAFIFWAASYGGSSTTTLHGIVAAIVAGAVNIYAGVLAIRQHPDSPDSLALRIVQFLYGISISYTTGIFYFFSLVEAGYGSSSSQSILYFGPAYIITLLIIGFSLWKMYKESIPSLMTSFNSVNPAITIHVFLCAVVMLTTVVYMPLVLGLSQEITQDKSTQRQNEHTIQEEKNQKIVDSDRLQQQEMQKKLTVTVAEDWTSQKLISSIPSLSYETPEYWGDPKAYAVLSTSRFRCTEITPTKQSYKIIFTTPKKPIIIIYTDECREISYNRDYARVKDESGEPITGKLNYRGKPIEGTDLFVDIRYNPDDFPDFCDKDIVEYRTCRAGPMAEDVKQVIKSFQIRN